ncbi:MAG: type II toxin-antitoxin system HicB family antitoxin [Deltaproteobacteria bacterium]|nr:MAG: type II toxin-antitoxin system HicB family antitoxin [Deltaproteobacteria bacterium]
MSLNFDIDLIPEEDGKGYYVIVPALPGCFSQGATVEEALKNVKEAISLHVKSLKRDGQKYPKMDRAFHTVVEIAI